MKENWCIVRITELQSRNSAIKSCMLYIFKPHILNKCNAYYKYYTDNLLL